MSNKTDLISFHKKVRITIQNEVDCIVTGLLERDLAYFVKKYTLHAENYFYNPKYKLGIWDGTLNFFSKGGKTYVNLIPEFVPKIIKLGYKIELNDQRKISDCNVDYIDNTYFSHIINPKNNTPYTLEEHQVEAANAVFDSNGGIVLAATGFGKAQPLTSKVLTTGGWKQMGDLTLNDVVITPSNRRAKILGLYPQGETECYKITFDDGGSAECDANHIWLCLNPALQHVRTKPYVQFTTLEVKHRLENITYSKIKPSIPAITNCIEFAEQQLPLDPYYFGLFLSQLSVNKDGDYILLNCQDTLIYKTLSTFLKDFNIKLRKINMSTCVFNIVDEYDAKTIYFFDTLRTLLNGTFAIPHIYKYTSIKHRLAFLAGICDAKAYIAGNGRITIQYVSNNEMKHDFAEMIWLLGGLSTFNGKNECIINHLSPEIFFVDLAKIKNYIQYGTKTSKVMHRRVVSVENIGFKETQCILIDDPDHLYITDDCLITHNTILNAAVVDRYNQTHGFKTLTIVPSVSLIHQTAAQFEILELDVGRFDGSVKELHPAHIVSTWQTLQNYPSLMSQFQLVLVDECHGANANSLNQLLLKQGSKIPVRIGFTGTLPKHEAVQMTIKIALGHVIYEKTAHTLIESGWLATPNISIMQLDDDNFIRRHADVDLSKLEYDQHLQLILTNDDRLNWISQFIQEKNQADHKGNILCLVGNVKYGKKLQKLIPNAIFLHGKDKQEVRSQVYELFETHDDLIVICTHQIAGVGLSIDRIFNLIFIDMGKSYVKTIQVIGRGLRKGRDKDSVNIVDICSNLPYFKAHMKQRIKYYKEAKYAYKQYLVEY